MKAYELNRDKVEALRKDCMELLRKDEAGCDTRTILKDMYCGFYSDKTEDIGYLMADKVIEYVGEYEREVVQAMEDADGWYEEKVHAILMEKESQEERCNTLYKVRVGLAAAELSASKGQEAAEAYVEEHSKKAFTAEESTEKLEAQLKEELKNTIENNALLVSVLNTYAENAANLDDGIEYTLIKYGEDASKFKAVVAMKSYLESGEDGYLADTIPADATLKDITYSACAGVDTLGVAAAVENGEIEEPLASQIIRGIGMVLGAIAALKIATVVGVAIISVATGNILTFYCGVLAAGIMLEAILEPSMEFGEKVVVITKEVVCFGARCVCVAARTVFAGIKKLVGFIGGLFRQDNGQENVQEIFEYTEPELEGEPKVKQEVIPVPTVLA